MELASAEGIAIILALGLSFSVLIVVAAGFRVITGSWFPIFNVLNGRGAATTPHQIKLDILTEEVREFKKETRKDVIYVREGLAEISGKLHVLIEHMPVIAGGSEEADE